MQQADTTTPATTAGHVIAGRYEIVEPLGRGSFGHTFLARDRKADRTVAIKVLDPRGTEEWKARELFAREANVLAALRHQGVPAVHELVSDAWKGAPALFLVMDYVEGVTIDAMIEERRSLDATDVMALFLELLGILDYLHNRVPPILHRDIKPANIVVRPDGTPALVDFGSVRSVVMAPDEAGSTVAGTYGYMPYEQYMGQASPASDLYALAATFLHLITGRQPQAFMTTEGRISVPENLPGDPRLGPILARLLRPSPAERFATARDVRQALLAPVGVSASGALVPVPAPTPGGVRLVAHRTASVLASLPPAPRPLTGDARALLDRAAYSVWEVMDTSSKRGDRGGVLDWAMIGFFSIVTVGILPIVFLAYSRARRRQLRRFLQHGTPGTGRVLGVEMENTGFGEKIARVSYEYEAEGMRHRDVDRVLPNLALKWQPGDEVPIMYIGGDDDYSSVIVAG